jgi:hypothetical protein
MTPTQELIAMLKRVLECAELNQDDIEPQTQDTIDQAYELLAREETT